MTAILSRRAGLAAAAALALPRGLRAQAGATLNLYSSRHYNTDEALYTEFTRATGIRINRIEAEGDPLIERMRAEGVNSPADLFISVDAGRIERARQLGLLRTVMSTALTTAVPAHLRDPDGHWFGFSKRARVIVYARDRADADLATRYEDLAEPKLKGRLVIRSSGHIYNQSLVGSLLAAHGEARTEALCRGIVANFARPPRGGDTDQLRAVASGESDIAVANTYYFANLMRSAKPEDRALIAKLGVVFPNQRDRGTHVNISGGGIAVHAKNPEGARAFLEYLVSPQAQAYFADGNSEYPVIAGAATGTQLAALGAFREDQLNARIFAENNPRALQIMERAGWR